MRTRPSGTMGQLLLITVLSTLVLTSTGNHTDSEWAAILPDMTSLCPSVDVCAARGANGTKSACCHGCSCAANCREEACCFPEDRTIDPVSLYTDCLEQSLVTAGFLPVFTFTFTVNAPIDGCKGDNPDATCSSDVIVAPWGNFWPVYSRSLNKNFKNELCARCHGADVDTIDYWTGTISLTTGSSKEVVSIMTDFVDSYNASEMIIVFDPPNEESGSMDKRCFKIIEECSSRWHENYYIPSMVQLDRTAINKACEQGPEAMFIQNVTHAYKNVFCALCNGFAIKVKDALQCSYGGDIKTGELSFTALIDPNLVKSWSSKPKPGFQGGHCFRPMNTTNDTSCARPHCPTFQVRLPDGKCDFIAETMNAKCFSLTLNLSTSNFIDRSAILKMTPTDVIAAFEEHTPWSDSWEIVEISMKTGDNMSEFLLYMNFKSEKSLNIRQFIPDNERSLSAGWILNVDGEIEYTQSLLTQFYSYESLKSVYFSPKAYRRFCIEITKLFYCEQIDLRPTEYRIDLPNVLHFLHLERVLYKNEYTYVVADDGTKKVRVCVEDSDYVRVAMESDASRLLFGPVMKFLAIGLTLYQTTKFGLS